MNNKFLNSINIMRQQGEISEQAFLKIRYLYNKEKEYEQSFWGQKSSVENLKKYKETTVNNNANQYTEKNITERQVVNTKNYRQVSVNNNQKAMSKEEQIKIIKERNITTILSAGIILIMLAGLILSTSTWNLMSNSIKTSCLLMISVLFFGMSVFTEKKLKIEKTSFAFWILGNLFLPIILLSIGYFKLFGDYLSIGNSGEYIFGTMSSIICLPFFGYSIKKYKNEYFAWLSLIDITLFWWFILKQINLRFSYELVIMLLYVVALSYIYNKLKVKKEVFSFIVRDIKIFSIIILAISAIAIEENIFSITSLEFTGKRIETIEEIFLVIGMIILAGIIIYWSYDFKINGFILVTEALIVATHMLCFSLKISTTQFTYYLIMYFVLIIMYALFYYWNNFKYIKHMKFGSEIIIIAVVIILGAISTLTLSAGYTGILLYILLILLYITNKMVESKDYRIFLNTLMAIILFMANQFIISATEISNIIFNYSGFHRDFIFAIINVVILYGISVVLRKLKSNYYKMYYYVAHSFMLLLYLFTIEFRLDNILVGIVISISLAICLYLSRDEKKVKFYLYGLITIIILILFNLELYFDFNSFDISLLKSENLLLLVSLILTAIWYLAQEKWKYRLSSYIILINFLGLFFSLALNKFQNLSGTLICAILTCIVSMNVFLYKSNKRKLMIIPLCSLFIMDLKIIYYLHDIERILVNYVVILILVIVGYLLNVKYSKINKKEVMYYNGISGLLLLVNLFISSGNGLSYVYGIIALIICGAFIYYLSIFSKVMNFKKGLMIISLFFYYIAYSKLIINLEFVKKFELELILVPSIWFFKLINDRYIGKENGRFKILLNIWYSIAGMILLIFNPQNNDFHAIVFGALCILSIIVGFKIQNKLYFMGGIIFLILGVFLNTLSFWLSIPWWIYLLTGGIILIIFASKNELNKGKNGEKKENIKDKLLKKIETWK